MKIENFSNVGGVVPEDKQRTPKTGAASFDQLLGQEMAGALGNGVTAVPAAEGVTPGIECALAPGRSVTSVSVSEPVGEVLERLLAACSPKSGGTVDLRAVSQGLTDLAQAAEDVLSRTQHMNEDHPVRRLALEARVLAYVESVKWRRGDYV